MSENNHLDNLVDVLGEYMDAEGNLKIAQDQVTMEAGVVETTMTAACVAIAVAKESTPLTQIIDYVTAEGVALSKGTFPNFEAVGRLMRLPGDLPVDWIVRKHPDADKAKVENGVLNGIVSLYSVVAKVESIHGKKGLKDPIDTATTKAEACGRLAASLKAAPSVKAAKKAATVEGRLKLANAQLQLAADSMASPDLGDTDVIKDYLAAITVNIGTINGRVWVTTASTSTT